MPSHSFHSRKSLYKTNRIVALIGQAALRLQLEQAVTSMLRPHVVLDLLANFTAFATHKDKQRIKIIARYQQVEGVKKIVEPEPWKCQISPFRGWPATTP